MVNLSLEEVLALEDIATQRRAVRRVFSTFHNPVDITGIEQKVICALVNLSSKETEKQSVFSSSGVKKRINEIKNIERWVKAYSYRHTHNVKFPDIRAQGCIRLPQSTHSLPSHLLSTDKIQQKRLGWSQNSADINFTFFLCADFLWNGQRLTISDAILRDIEELQEVLFRVGFYKTSLATVRSKLTAIPEFSVQYTKHSAAHKLLRYPSGNMDYLCITPVVSHDMQRFIHILASNDRRHRETFYVQRPSSAGKLASDCGGRVKILRTFPRGLKSRHTYKYEFHWLTADFIRALGQLQDMEKTVLPQNQHDAKQREIAKRIRAGVTKWIEAQLELASLEHIESRKITAGFNKTLSKTIAASRFAYRPTITRYLEKTIDRILKEMKATALPHMDSELSQEDEEHFILLPSLEVHGGNALHAPFSCGLPSIIGVYGFVHAFVRQLKSNFSIDCQNVQFAICMHSLSLQRRGMTREKVVAKDGYIRTPGIIDSINCDFAISLLIRCNGSLLSQRALRASLPTKLCGGAVHLSEQALDTLSRYKSFDEAHAAMPLKNGKWLIMDNEMDFQSFFDVSEIDTVDNDLLLSTLGYRLLNTAEANLDSSKEELLNFADHILASIKCVRAIHGDKNDRLFWSYTVDNHSVFCSTGGYDATS